jgi:hypothetical protein
MTSTPDFDDLVGDDLPPEERDRLLRVHELLVAAGPPPELPPSLADPPRPQTKVALLPSRRRYTFVGVAAAAVLAAFVGGYLAGGHGAGFSTAAVRPMHGTRLAPLATATIRVAEPDKAGNWPMRFSVSGLPALRRGEYYELYLSRHGKPIATCGTFTVHGGTTVVRLNAPYELRRFDGWVVTRHEAGARGDGPVLLTT